MQIVLVAPGAKVDDVPATSLQAADLVVQFTGERAEVLKNTGYGKLNVEYVVPNNYTEHHAQMHTEWETWRTFCEVLKKFGVGDINTDEPHEEIALAAMRWGEELAELRRLDPDPTHAANALVEKREGWNNFQAKQED